MRRPALITLLLLAPVLAACGSGKSDKSDTSSAQGAPAAAPARTTPATGASGCQQVAAPAPKPDGGGTKPKQPLDASKTWTLEVKTSCGDFTVTLNLKTAPKASASMVGLAQAGFFKNTIFHRIVPGFVIQGGDPTGQGTGGPGYSTVDPPPRNARYTQGVVAMAKTQSEAPGTAGSQFYVVTGADSGLPPDYALIGKVTKGIEAVNRIGVLGDQNQQPTQTVVIYDIVAAGS